MWLRVGLVVGISFLLACSDDAADSREGDACESARDCDGLACVAELEGDPEDLSPLTLSCGDATKGEAAGRACEAASECALGVCLLAGACATPCETEGQCDDDQRCDFVYARTVTEALQTLHACVDMVVLPKDALVKIETRKRELRGAIDDVTLPGVSTDTLFVLEHLDDERWPFSNTSCRTPLCALRLVTRDAKPVTLFDFDRVDTNSEGPINTVANDLHVNPVTVLLPNSDRTKLADKGYVLSLESTMEGDLRVTQLQRKQRGERLDLNVFYVGAKGFSPTGARGPALLADAIDEVDRIYAQADIFVGEVRQIEVANELLEHGTKIEGVDVGTGFARITSHFGVYPQLPELFKLSAGAGNVAINLFLVADMEMGSFGGDVGGIAGGTPGPLGMHGTAGSGIAISTDMMIAQNDPKRLGRVIAHEIGHMLGLFHPTETSGLVFEPLSDTPVCKSEADCIDNLMFPTSQGQDSVMLTEDQRDVLRASIILQ